MSRPGFPPRIRLVVDVNPEETIAVEGNTASAESPQWVVFACDGRRFGFPMARVREILPARPVTRLPGCGPAVCGLIVRRGRVITTLDFGAAMTLRPAAARADHRLLLIDHDPRLVGFAVEDVVTVLRAPRPGARMRADGPGNGTAAPDISDDAALGVIGVGADAFLAVEPGPVLTRLLR